MERDIHSRVLRHWKRKLDVPVTSVPLPVKTREGVLKEALAML